jgi:hypothetical protein
VLRAEFLSGPQKKKKSPLHKLLFFFFGKQQSK